MGWYLDARWGTADFGIGDVLTFTAYTVHMGLHNESNEVGARARSRGRKPEA